MYYLRMFTNNWNNLFYYFSVTSILEINTSSQVYYYVGIECYNVIFKNKNVFKIGKNQNIFVFKIEFFQKHKKNWNIWFFLNIDIFDIFKIFEIFHIFKIFRVFNIFNDFEICLDFHFFFDFQTLIFSLYWKHALQMFWNV